MLSILFIFIAGIFKAFMDYASEGLSTKKWWNKSESWVLKYKNPLETLDKSPWYYLGLYKPKYKESFPYSTTILVFLTDGWHFFQMLFLTFFVLSIVFYWPIFTLSNIYLSIFLDFVLLRVVLGVSFEIVYYTLKKAKKNVK